MEITITQIVIALAAAVMVGFSKTGLPSLGIFVVAIMAIIFPAKESVGILLPMLITADLVAVTYYRRSVVWKHLITLIPWVLAGILVGFFVLGRIQNEQLSVLIGLLVLTLISLHLSKDKLEQKLQFRFTQSAGFHAVLGILAGFTTMIGNAAGAIMAIYLLSKGSQKKEFIGTGAWFFLSVNLIKVPFSVYLGLITPDTLLFNAWMIPAILAGTFAGIKILPLIPQKYFQIIILTFAALGAIRLILEFL
jgi:uncharacterized membrane protein YfcA